MSQLIMDSDYLLHRERSKSCLKRLVFGSTVICYKPSKKRVNVACSDIIFGL